MSRRLFAVLGLGLVLSVVTFVGCDTTSSTGTSTAPVGHTGMPPGTDAGKAGGPAAAPAKK